VLANAVEADAHVHRDAMVVAALIPAQVRPETRQQRRPGRLKVLLVRIHLLGRNLLVASDAERHGDIYYSIFLFPRVIGSVRYNLLWYTRQPSHIVAKR